MAGADQREAGQDDAAQMSHDDLLARLKSCETRSAPRLPSLSVIGVAEAGVGSLAGGNPGESAARSL
jgi:hypothetical protein